MLRCRSVASGLRKAGIIRSGSQAPAQSHTPEADDGHFEIAFSEFAFFIISPSEPFPHLQAKEKRNMRAFPILPISCLILLDHGLTSSFLATATAILVHKRNPI
jgi:hypothetical protein